MLGVLLPETHGQRHLVYTGGRAYDMSVVHAAGRQHIPSRQPGLLDGPAVLEVCSREESHSRLGESHSLRQSGASDHEDGFGFPIREEGVVRPSCFLIVRASRVLGHSYWHSHER